MCPVQDHFISLTLLIISSTFVLHDPDVGLSVLVCVVLSVLLYSARIVSFLLTCYIIVLSVSIHISIGLTLFFPPLILASHSCKLFTKKNTVLCFTSPPLPSHCVFLPPISFLFLFPIYVFCVCVCRAGMVLIRNCHLHACSHSVSLLCRTIYHISQSICISIRTSFSNFT